MDKDSSSYFICLLRSANVVAFLFQFWRKVKRMASNFQRDLKTDVQSCSFRSLSYANVGNSQMLGLGAGLVSRRDAYKFLQQRDWDSESIIKILDAISVDEEQNVRKEDLIRSAVAIMCKDGSRRTLSDAIAISSCSCECTLQFQGTLIPTASAPKMDMWHQQVCCHLGLKGFVRLCYTGIILDVGLVLQGNEDDLVAYIDGLLAPNITGNGESLIIPFRRLGPEETRLSELMIVTHADKEEMLDQHASDMAAIDQFTSACKLNDEVHSYNSNIHMEPQAHELGAGTHDSEKPKNSYK
ncbi:hypothetical protein GUITHDRAFT_119128 [Guillardia theta CCMP2712]|uniref:Uncharacterized protein n=1 Tax=Guillardia theta (strain CCMP2712) TaxID=905079 RepID=L1IFT1_GUITC|nr:hypothetical protein GUITHDRAFT_119128 [Guillardia theta CCMP2712]EKX34695.1 hypothetical protein GUITHDRAFT_119128 [Guillardia theta CCMP2712]|eukprot:XP_005821675.1 hypothetical protein GUITHDRAFT_119128 [Guillardia theta CCMP2712]